MKLSAQVLPVEQKKHRDRTTGATFFLSFFLSLGATAWPARLRNRLHVFPSMFEGRRFRFLWLFYRFLCLCIYTDISLGMNAMKKGSRGHLNAIERNQTRERESE